MATDPQEAMKVRFTKDGEFYKGTQIASPERFEEMMRTALDFCERYVSEIRAGRTDIAPIRRGKRRACDFCDYKARRMAPQTGRCSISAGFSGG